MEEDGVDLDADISDQVCWIDSDSVKRFHVDIYSSRMRTRRKRTKRRTRRKTKRMRARKIRGQSIMAHEDAENASGQQELPQRLRFPIVVMHHADQPALLA